MPESGFDRSNNMESALAEANTKRADFLANLAGPGSAPEHFLAYLGAFSPELLSQKEVVDCVVWDSAQYLKEYLETVLSEKSLGNLEEAEREATKGNKELKTSFLNDVSYLRELAMIGKLEAGLDPNIIVKNALLEHLSYQFSISKEEPPEFLKFLVEKQKAAEEEDLSGNEPEESLYLSEEDIEKEREAYRKEILEKIYDQSPDIHPAMAERKADDFFDWLKTRRYALDQEEEVEKEIQQISRLLESYPDLDLLVELLLGPYIQIPETGEAK